MPLHTGLGALNCYGRRTDADSDGEDAAGAGGEAGTSTGSWWGSGPPSRSASAQPQRRIWPPWPPPDESELERAVRLEEEREAKRISDAIDRALESERQALRPRRRDMKLLLLGQSESGKSTMLKNFQIQFAPSALRAESEAWRVVIQLNLVRTVNFILDVLTRPPTAAPAKAPTGDTSPTTSAFSNRLSATPQPNSDLRRFKLALSPLRQVEMILAKHLSVDDIAAASAHPNPIEGPSRELRATEVTIRGGRRWTALVRPNQKSEEQRTRYAEGRAEDIENARHVLDACRDDVIAMCTNQAILGALKEELHEGVVLEDHSSFFLSQATRVMQSTYEPTFDDILRARLQTTGVEEHHMIMETGEENGQHWIFYDVGGTRSQRASWVSFFDDVNAIIFLCSTAGYNEVLAEDRNVNRLMDSFTTWKTICSSKLLAAVQFIMLLNKTDLLEARLKAGIRFSKYVESYTGPDELESVTDYLRRKLAAIHRHHSPAPRKLHVHCTCAIDIDTTSAVLMRIRDTILVNHLAAIQLI
ncbi:guanine nucleotide binding protein, alpha subunit [Trametes gibbosa]|nr:guanine nucleotide binding protein, alpha subunit [Trametes gibbosa]